MDYKVWYLHSTNLFYKNVLIYTAIRKCGGTPQFYLTLPPPKTGILWAKCITHHGLEAPKQENISGRASATNCVVTGISYTPKGGNPLKKLHNRIPYIWIPPRKESHATGRRRLHPITQPRLSKNRYREEDEKEALWEGKGGAEFSKRRQVEVLELWVSLESVWKPFQTFSGRSPQWRPSPVREVEI